MDILLIAGLWLDGSAWDDVPVTVVCPEFSPADARGWVAGGHLPELAKASAVTYADLDSGHWPMITQPARLAELLADAAGRERL